MKLYPGLLYPALSLSTSDPWRADRHKGIAVPVDGRTNAGKGLIVPGLGRIGRDEGRNWRDTGLIDSIANQIPLITIKTTTWQIFFQKMPPLL